MAKTEYRDDWAQHAAFMRDVGATHAEWDEQGRVIKLTLAPLAQPGPAARMKAFHENNTNGKTSQERAHEILFAASSVRPMMNPTATTPQSVVPRAVRAKEAAARRGENQG